VLFTSFEDHRPLASVLAQVGDTFHWPAHNDTERRRRALQLFAQVPILWIWDNVEHITGFPAGTPSAWTDAEQSEFADFLRDLAQHTTAKVLLTSCRDERGWLGGLPARVRLPPMPMLERLQLAEALAGKHGQQLLDLDAWRPLLHYTAGNPLTLTVVVDLALRNGLASRAQVEAFVARLRAGEADIDDETQGRTASLGASLSYGLRAAFTEAEQAQLAVLHLFHDTVNAAVLGHMGTEGTPPPVPALAGLTREHGIALLNRAADIGLLTPLRGGCYSIHPVLPWHFNALFHRHHPGPAGEAVAHAYTAALAHLGNSYHRQVEQGHEQAVYLLAAEEANLLHARRLARAHHQWDQLLGVPQGLRALYQRQGRRAGWARLVAEIIPDLTDPVTDRPLPGRHNQWAVLTSYRIRLAIGDRDWPAATRLITLSIDHNRQVAANALAADPTCLDDDDRKRIHNLAIAHQQLGEAQREQGQVDCIHSFQRAADLCRLIDERPELATLALQLGHAYLTVPELRDLDRAERHYQESLDLTAEHDQLGHASATGQLGQVAWERFLDARRAGAPATALADHHLGTAAHRYHQALTLLPANATTQRAAAHNMLGNIYHHAGRRDLALTHFQKSINYFEATGDRYNAGVARYNIALHLADASRYSDAILYARAAVVDYASYGPAAAADADKARRLIARIEQAAT
jgi:tetratricopeptide (TPR) repeat protein